MNDAKGVLGSSYDTCVALVEQAKHATRKQSTKDDAEFFFSNLPLVMFRSSALAASMVPREDTQNISLPSLLQECNTHLFLEA